MEWAGQLTGKISDQMEPSQPAFIIHIIAIYNPGHNILALFNNLADARIPTSKTILDI